MSPPSLAPLLSLQEVATVWGTVIAFLFVAASELWHRQISQHFRGWLQKFLIRFFDSFFWFFVFLFCNFRKSSFFLTCSNFFYFAPPEVCFCILANDTRVKWGFFFPFWFRILAGIFQRVKMRLKRKLWGMTNCSVFIWLSFFQQTLKLIPLLVNDKLRWTNS